MLKLWRIKSTYLISLHVVHHLPFNCIVVEKNPHKGIPITYLFDTHKFIKSDLAIIYFSKSVNF